MASASNRQARILRHFAISLGALLLLSVPFWLYPLDLAISGSFFDVEKKWAEGEAPIWKFLYEIGPLPAILFGILGIVAFVLSFRLATWVKWRKLSAWAVLAMILGPAVLINLVFKNQWGRPRPRDVEPFGGPFAHERVWQWDGSSPGDSYLECKSFPCGHCSMGFWFLGLFLILRGPWRWIGGGAALVFGTLIGMARIAQGGHFASDVLWSAGMCWLASLGLYHAFRLDENRLYQPSQKPGQLRIPVPVWIGAGVVSAVGITAALLGTPYSDDVKWEVEILDGKFELSLVLVGTNHEIRLHHEPVIVVETEGSGFGIPGSAIKHSWKEDPNNEDGYYVQLKQRHSGWFTELKQMNRISVPAELEGYIRLEVDSGALNLDLSGLEARQSWRVSGANPDIAPFEDDQLLDFRQE